MSGWRTVVISGVCKLDYRMNYLVVRQADDIKRIFMDEISCVIIESTAVSMTSYAICELIKRKVNIIYCDEKRNPMSIQLPLYGSHDTSLSYKNQMSWSEEVKDSIWSEIIKRKILGQSLLLSHRGHEDASMKLKSYISEIEPCDKTNREGFAAKVYFNELMGNDFNRRDDSAIDSYLNYGYAILLSDVAREVCSCGYATQIGIHHDNRFNSLNLACDLMEPFRPFVDDLVLSFDQIKEDLDHEDKMKLVEFLNKQVHIGDKDEFMTTAIRIYTKSVIDAINANDKSQIIFPEYEFEIYENNSVL